MKWIRNLLLISMTAAIAAAAPSIIDVQDAAGYDTVITRGAMAIVKGSGLGPDPLIKVDSFPLMTTFHGASVKIEVNGTTTEGIMYYVWDTQSAFVLPSGTPAGTGTLTYTYNGESTTHQVTVVDRNPQIYTLDSSGSGPGVVTFQANNFFGNGILGNDNAVNPGNIVILWMQGLGPVQVDEANPVPNLIDLSQGVQITVGGVTPETIYYMGREPSLTSVDIIQFTWPSGIQQTCNVPIQVTIGSRTSNTVTAPAADSGRTCTPASTGTGGGSSNPIDNLFTQNELSNIVNSSTITGGTINYTVSKNTQLVGAGGQVVETTTNSEGADAVFMSVTPNSGVDSNTVSAALDSIILKGGEYGSCVTSTIDLSNPLSSFNINLNDFGFQTLDAGTLTASDGFGTKTFQKQSALGFTGYNLDFTPGQLSNSSSVTTTSTGSADVDPFTATINMPAGFSVTNLDSLRTITRSNGIPVNWTPQNQGIVTITASTTSGGTVIPGVGSVPGSGGTSKTVTCVASAADGSFTIPASTANYLDATQGYTGSLSIMYSYVIRVPSSNLDFVVVTAGNDTIQSAQFN